MPIFEPPTDTRESKPYLPLDKEGEFANLAIIRESYEQATDMQGQPKTWSDGNPVMRYVLTGIITGGQGTVKVPKQDGPEAIVPGLEVVVYIDGPRAKPYRQWRSTVELGTGYTLQVKVTGLRANPHGGKKIKEWGYSVRPPKPEESEMVAACEARYEELVNGASEAPSAAAFDDESIPF